MKKEKTVSKILDWSVVFVVISAGISFFSIAFSIAFDVFKRWEGR